MTKTILIGSVITATSVIMILSSVMPMLSVHPSTDGGGDTNIPVTLALAYADGCERSSKTQVCVAVDPDRDGICDGQSFLISYETATDVGVNGFCTTDNADSR